MKKYLLALLLITSALLIIKAQYFSASTPPAFSLDIANSREDNVASQSTSDSKKSIAHISLTNDSAKIEEAVGRADVSVENKLWGLSKFKPEQEQIIRAGASIDHGVVEKLSTNPELIEKLMVDSTVILDLPGSLNSVTVRVNSVVVVNNIRTIVGSIDGLGVGYGVTLSQSGDVLIGDIINEEGNWSIDMFGGDTYISNGRKSIGFEHDAL